MSGATGFGKAKLPDGGLVLSSSQFSLLSLLPQKKKLKMFQKYPPIN